MPSGLPFEGARCARMLWAGALGAAAGLAAPGPPWPPSRPTPPCCAAGAFSGMRAGRGGAARCSPRPFSRAPLAPPSPRCARAGASGGRCAPVARLRQPPGAGCGPPLGPAALAPWRGPAGYSACGLGPALRGSAGFVPRPWPSPGGPCARLRRPPVPPGSALRAGAAPRPGSSRPGAVRPGGRSCPPPPGVGFGGSAACGRRCERGCGRHARFFRKKL